MRLISKTRSIAAAGLVGDATLAAKILRWHQVITGNSYRTFVALKEMFPSVDLVRDRLGFNLASHRLMAGFNFQTRTIFFKHLLSDDESMRKEWQA